METKDMIRDLRRRTGLTQKNFSGRYGIPMRTYQCWESGESTPPEYVIRLLGRAVDEDFGPKDAKPVDQVGEV